MKMIQAKGARPNSTGSQPMTVSFAWFLADMRNNATIAETAIATAVASTAVRPAAMLFRKIMEVPLRLRRQPFGQESHGVTQRLISITARRKWRVGHFCPCAIFLYRNGNIVGNIGVGMGMPQFKFVQLFLDNH